jgi:hypothetical protein
VTLAPHRVAAVEEAEQVVAAIRAELATPRWHDPVPRALAAIAQLHRVELRLARVEPPDARRRRLLEGIRFFRCELAQRLERTWTPDVLEAEGLVEIDEALAELRES